MSDKHSTGKASASGADAVFGTSVIRAADKKPEDFEPMPRATVHKMVTSIVIKRGSGEEEVRPLILRAGDSVVVNGKTVLSLALVASEG